MEDIGEGVSQDSRKKQLTVLPLPLSRASQMLSCLPLRTGAVEQTVKGRAQFVAEMANGKSFVLISKRGSLL
jgi:hypothetical protein